MASCEAAPLQRAYPLSFATCPGQRRGTANFRGASRVWFPVGHLRWVLDGFGSLFGGSFDQFGVSWVFFVGKFRLFVTSRQRPALRKLLGVGATHAGNSHWGSLYGCVLLPSRSAAGPTQPAPAVRLAKVSQSCRRLLNAARAKV